MLNKRKSEATRLDEVDRSMYSTFCSAANSLSQLNTQATHQQSLSFQAGERHALGKLYDWILTQQEDGIIATDGDVLDYLRKQLNYTQATHQQSLSFQAGERHALGKLYDWILIQQEDGIIATDGDVLDYLRKQLNYVTAEPPLRSQTMVQTTNYTGRFPVSSNNATSPGIAGDLDQTAGQGVPWNLMHRS